MRTRVILIVAVVAVVAGGAIAISLFGDSQESEEQASNDSTADLTVQGSAKTSARVATHPRPPSPAPTPPILTVEDLYRLIEHEYGPWTIRQIISAVLKREIDFAVERGGFDTTPDDPVWQVKLRGLFPPASLPAGTGPILFDEKHLYIDAMTGGYSGTGLRGGRHREAAFVELAEARSLAIAVLTGIPFDPEASARVYEYEGASGAWITVRWG